MRQGVLDLREFYASPLGRAARVMVARKVTEAWDAASGLDVLALGYATPFLDGLGDSARRVVAAMPASQGVEAWPAGEKNCATLADETALPFGAAFFDRILAVHALEEAENPLALLAEAHRVLSPSGRIIVVVTARHSLWANAETTPFGQGRPFSRRQLEALVREAELEPTGWTRALYAPPFRWAARWAEACEQAGPLLWPPFAGLILLEAVKQTFAVKPRGARVRARAPVPSVLQPATRNGAASLGARMHRPPQGLDRWPK
ncbi:MAG TPA: methyltransferase domain-containing protein [Caulobacteraceae bacterium]|nr:methyltransferase domain-containing protein [Caulobacteraceae bacterium]